MICKSCGSESRGSVCTHCGTPFVYESYVEPEKGATTPVQTGGGRKRPAKSARSHARAQRKAAFLQPKSDFTFGEALPIILVLLLPLSYLFFEVFLRYPAALLEGGPSTLSLLIFRLTDGAFLANPMGDILTATYGNAPLDVAYYTAHAALAAGEMEISAALLLVAAALSGISALMLLFTGGRALRCRFCLDFTVFSALYSAAAPFLSVFYSYFVSDTIVLSYFDSDTLFSATRVHFTVEGLLIAAVLLCLLPLAARRACRLAHGDTLYVPLLARMTGRCFGKTPLRLLAFLFALASACLPLVFVFFSFKGEATLISLFIDELFVAGGDLEMLVEGISLGEPLTAVTAISYLYLLIFLPLLLLFSFFALLSAFRILFATAKRTAGNLKCRARLARTGGALRRPLWLMLFSLLLIKGIAFFALLYGGAFQAHLADAAIAQTLSAYYWLILFVKVLFPVSFMGAVLSAGAFFLTVLAGNLARAFVRLNEV